MTNNDDETGRTVIGSACPPTGVLSFEIAELMRTLRIVIRFGSDYVNSARTTQTVPRVT